MVGIRKDAKRVCGDKNLPRKFERWQEENHKLVTDLVISIFDPMSKSMLEETIGFVVLKEHGDAGFRVESLLTEEAEIEYRNAYFKAKRKMRRVVCMVVFYIESASTGKQTNMGLTFISLGEEHKFGGMIQDAKRAKENQAHIVQQLNAE